MKLRLCLAMSIVAALMPTIATAEYVPVKMPPHVVAFLESHCFRCHGAKEQKAGLRLDNLGVDFLAGKTADQWKEAIDLINLGQMPPEDQPQPDAEKAFAVVEWINAELRRAERSARETGGRGLMRRLNRDEYAYTVGDLLQLNPNFVKQLREELPADGKAEGFDRISTALFFDRTQLERYLAAADVIVREAVQDEPPQSSAASWKAKLRAEDFTKTTKITDTDHEIPRGALYAAARDGGVEYIGAKRTFQKALDAAGWMGIPDAEIKLDGIVKRDGYYRVRFTAGADRGARGTPVQMHLQYGRDTPIEVREAIDVAGTLDKPTVVEKLVFLRAGRGEQKVSMRFHWNPIQDLVPANPALIKLVNKRVGTFAQIPILIEKKAPKSEVDALKKQLDDVVKQLYAFTEPAYVYNDKYDLKTAPRLFLQSIEVAGPIVEWPPASHGTLGLTEDLPADEAGFRRVFTQLLTRAYRRPVDSAEVEKIVQFAATAMRDRGLSFQNALRVGLKMMLVSPGFVMLQEPQPEAAGTAVRPLDDYELAARLSYFLWNSLPDDELTRLAAAGKLREPTMLRNQTARMLRDPKSRRFVESFAGQWLSVGEFGSVEPARDYVSYDEPLELAELEEPLAFFQHVLGENLSIANFLDSDFLVINARLAKHYGIDGVTDIEFRVVKIGPEHHRGGVLGMGGLLTLLSDGTRTLPVRRAAWVLEALLNDPPLPPPPNAGDIQPNTAGQNLSVRERLQRHRDEPSCASCHVKLDPYGLALENYDAIGAYRVKQNGEGIREAKAPVIDASGKLKSGREFTDLAGFKAALLVEKNKFAQAFVEKLLTYALCRPIGYVDRKTVDEVVYATAADDCRLQDLIQAIVASPAFQTK